MRTPATSCRSTVDSDGGLLAAGQAGRLAPPGKSRGGRVSETLARPPAPTAASPEGPRGGSRPCWKPSFLQPLGCFSPTCASSVGGARGPRKETRAALAAGAPTQPFTDPTLSGAHSRLVDSGEREP